MTAGLTSEEIVTRLLTSNEIIKNDKKHSFDSYPNNNLGDFLTENSFEEEENKFLRYYKENSKYAFIDTDLNWGF